MNGHSAKEREMGSRKSLISRVLGETDSLERLTWISRPVVQSAAGAASAPELVRLSVPASLVPCCAASDLLAGHEELQGSGCWGVKGT